MNENSKNFSKEMRDERKYQIKVTELKNTVTELKKIHQRNSTADQMKHKKMRGPWSKKARK